MSAPSIDAIVFDLGGVLVDWNPRYLYRAVFAGDEAAMERFLAEVMTSAWIVAMDAGQPMAEAVASLAERHPAHAPAIEAYLTRWPEMYRGALDGTVALLAALKERGWPLYALTNWSAETFPIMRPRYPFLEWFDGIVVSGAERLVKPDPRLFAVLVERFALEPARTVFVDDSARNAAAAEALGFRAIRFVGAPELRAELAGLGLP